MSLRKWTFRECRARMAYQMLLWQAQCDEDGAFLERISLDQTMLPKCIQHSVGMVLNLRDFLPPSSSRSTSTVHSPFVSSHLAFTTLVFAQMFSSRIFAYESNQSASLSLGEKIWRILLAPLFHAQSRLLMETQYLLASSRENLSMACGRTLQS